MSKEIILTGLRANGTFHLGNYLGGIQPMVNLQRDKAGEYQINMFVPDLHSFTTPVEHQHLFRSTITNLKMYVAAGLDVHDPDTFVYRQSYIPAHSEMAWILDCFAYFGEISRMTQFKEKSDGQANVSVALFNYPVLMAADILLYNAKWVPLGDDQKQHLEITRDIGERLNNKFGTELFVLPETWDKQLQFAQREVSVRIRSLVDPTKKMSKSISDPRGTIELTDDPVEAAKKVMSATTDSLGKIAFNFAEQPGISNLLQILALLTHQSQAAVNTEWEGKNSYGDLKKAVAEAVQVFLTDFQTKLAAVDEIALMAKLEESEERMREATAPVLYRVQQAVGLRPQE
ncbi:MAG TPA: tryptophan--tRNA ligase [Candidatus Saccharimonadales bacterium]|nr:tryptophan--tRNA ligase [Candidatus Saccharimonadales bacterium]